MFYDDDDDDDDDCRIGLVGVVVSVTVCRVGGCSCFRVCRRVGGCSCFRECV